MVGLVVPVSADEAPKPTKKPSVEVVFCLDTTGSMGGLVGAAPTLIDLEEGDLKMGIDFRRVYASILEDWLGLPAKAALHSTFEKLPLFRT